MDNGYTLNYAPTAVQHLGVGLYKQLPQALTELITNSWDADATKVNININYSKREITVSDNGIGMTHEELNKDFLRVAKNRRLQKRDGLTPKGRKVTGKKGLGKLALFGIANKIQVYSVKNGLENAFEMDYKAIQNTNEDEQYHPKTLLNNSKTEEKNRTSIIITDLTIKNITKLEILKKSLSKRFNKYSRENFLVTVKDEKNNTFTLDESVFENSIIPKKLEFTYRFPDDFSEELSDNETLKKLNKARVTGAVFTKSTPLNSTDQGFYILSRGKLASERSTHQFSERANDNFYSYSVGYFNIDYIDDQPKEDYISTDRQSILWDISENLTALREELNSLVNLIQRRWRADRKKNKTKKEERITRSIPLAQEIMDNPDTTENDKNIIKKTTSILEDNNVNIPEKKKRELLNTTIRGTEKFKQDNSVYKELIPSNFIVPAGVPSKIRRLREETGKAFADKENPDRFILTQGLLLRALLDTILSSVLIHNIDEINSLFFKERPKDKYQIYFLTLNKKFDYVVKFLYKKGQLAKKPDVLTSQFNNMKIIGKLDQLMHDDSLWPNFDSLKEMWDFLCPIFIKSFDLIKNN